MLGQERSGTSEQWGMWSKCDPTPPPLAPIKGRVSLACIPATPRTSGGQAPKAVMEVGLNGTIHISIGIGSEGKGLQLVAPVANMENFLGKDLRPRVATWNTFYGST